jgi:predicted DNA binding CopG/RHH family protein
VNHNDEKEDARITLRISREIYRALRIEAARRDMSATRLINLLLEEAVGHIATST